MRLRSSWPFLGALLSAAAFGVHQLRYAVAFGSDAGSALEGSGHDYLTFAKPLIGLALAFALAHAVWRIAGGGRAHRISRRRLAALLALTLLLVYTGQELLEGELAAGHASGLAGVFGSGGWVAVPLALTLGGALSLAVDLVDAATEAIGAGANVPLPRPAPPTEISNDAAVVVERRPSPIARHLAGRAPPTRPLVLT